MQRQNSSLSAQYYNSDLSIWISVDPLVDKYPNLSPYTYCANNPVRIFDEDGRDIGIPPFDIGINISIGTAIVVDGLIYKRKAMRSTMTISNNYQAVKHYYWGGGSKVELDPKYVTALMNTESFKKMHQKIISGANIDENNGKPRTSGSFGVDMTNEKDAFFIGHTGVKYEVTTSKNKKNCTVTYTFFMKGDETDDFSDPNCILEKKTDDDSSIMRIGGDGMGPKLELGGKPYKFKSQQRSFTFANPCEYE